MLEPLTFSLGPVSYVEVYMRVKQEEAWKYTTLLPVALSPRLCLVYTLGWVMFCTNTNLV